MNALGLVRLLNTGLVVFDQVGPLLQRSLETGQDIDLEEVARRSGRSSAALQSLADAIARAEAEGR